ncbi:DUF2163 domain-containing protein [Paracoccus sp. JM45]|uniref:DUF2163 domain-containing protein n=1 Tax=Paracoccus sp. JM45 TaxID=2283626 RepID=UPI000E6CE1DE|nr:DUF2163 domain-containing protein [Paracoccus sp. JM45]RJE81225.1 DUF2163 domain-containing protein [Paracoccus sp. JM45]
MTTTTFARAWSVRRADGFLLGFTDHDRGLDFEGISFRPDLGLTAQAIVQATGLSVDNTEASGALDNDAITERDLMAGRWDDAELQMWEVDWSDVTSRKLVFRGSLGEVTRANGAFQAELRGIADKLNAPQGRVYHPRCSARLGDGSCCVNLATEALSLELAVQDVRDGRIFTFDAFPAFAGNWFEQGQLHLLDGNAQGLHAAIKNDTAHEDGTRTIELWAGLAIPPAAGDRIKLIAGCDKAAGTCRLKFNNFLNFRGFPHLPSEDWLLAPQVGG